MKSITELRKDLDNNIITKEELFNESISKARKYQKDYNSFVTILDNYENIDSDNILNGIPYALKDNISTKGILSTGSSNILANYIPVFNATVYEKLKNTGATLVGKTVLDELAMGGTGTTGHTGIVHNPWNKERITGGSSAGSAAAVALGIVPFAIGSDTGDSVRQPSAYCGVIGFKPTYGRISRYGLFPYASSLDHVGIIARTVKDIAIVTDIVKGHDAKDMTTLPDDNINYVDNLDNDIKEKKLFYIKEICNKELYDEETSEVLDNFYDNIKICKELGMEVSEESIDVNILEAIYPTYLSISNSESTSNNANLTGIHFGVNGLGNDVESIIKDSRTKGFSKEIKERFIIGSYILQRENQDKLYLNACRARRVITNKMNELFKKYDALILPTTKGIAPKINEKKKVESEKHMLLDRHLIIGNFGGYPSITIPCGFIKGMPLGLSITSDIKKDDLVLNIANKLTEKLDYSNEYPKEVE